MKQHEIPIPQANVAARGNGLQLLGRVTLLKKDVRSFEPAMAEAEELASTIDPAKNSIHGHYNLGLVYEEYAKNYTAMGKTHKALEPNSTKWPSKPLQTGINTFI